MNTNSTLQGLSNTTEENYNDRGRGKAVYIDEPKTKIGFEDGGTPKTHDKYK